MERRTLAAHRWRLIFFSAAGFVGAWLLRHVLRALAMQLLAAALLAAAALPLCRHMEKKLPASLAAVLALAVLLSGAAAMIMLLLPPLMTQLRALGESLPALTENLQAAINRFILLLEEKGIDLTALRDGLLARLSEAAGNLVARAMALLTTLIGSLSKVLLAPLMSFYLLRDRRRISSWLTLLLPVKHRARGVRAAREMKRESAAFLRGQLILSAAVGSMTAAVLALLRIPGWLLLGALMGALELVPYIGPVIAGVPAVLLALQSGWARALWTLAALVVIQEIEGAVLSPRLVGDATALHPLAVLLLVSAGGMLGGALGMVAVIPAVVSLRGALRGWRE